MDPDVFEPESDWTEIAVADVPQRSVPEIPTLRLESVWLSQAVRGASVAWELRCYPYDPTANPLETDPGTVLYSGPPVPWTTIADLVTAAGGAPLLPGLCADAGLAALKFPDRPDIRQTTLQYISPCPPDYAVYRVIANRPAIERREFLEDAGRWAIPPLHFVVADAMRVPDPIAHVAYTFQIERHKPWGCALQFAASSPGRASAFAREVGQSWVVNQAAFDWKLVSLATREVVAQSKAPAARSALSL